MKRLIIWSSLLLSVSAHSERWNKTNNPFNFNSIVGVSMKTEFHALPPVGKLSDIRLGWSETYWPSNLGGIAYRWNSPAPMPFNYTSPQKSEILRLKDSPDKLQDFLSKLSPAELYDISQSDYNYSLTKKVLKTYSPRAAWWEGICHGWSLAASNYPEPDKVVVTNKEGIAVPFGSSDVKGLLAMHDAFNSKGKYARVGDRCRVKGKVPGEEMPEDGKIAMPDPKEANRSECKDVNAGAFHIVLTNMIGIHSQGFVADVDRFSDVWNQPISGYESTVLEDMSVSPAEYAYGVSKKYLVTTTMHYGDELEFKTPKLEAEGNKNFVSKDPVTGTPHQLTVDRRYEYILELDHLGNIIGGEWLSVSRPDMLWMKSKDTQFNDGRFSLQGLNAIYKPVHR
jgi:hypothetical protein